jgi:hypothetical protein
MKTKLPQAYIDEVEFYEREGDRFWSGCIWGFIISVIVWAGAISIWVYLVKP